MDWLFVSDTCRIYSQQICENISCLFGRRFLPFGMSFDQMSIKNAFSCRPHVTRWRSIGWFLSNAGDRHRTACKYIETNLPGKTNTNISLVCFDNFSLFSLDRIARSEWRKCEVYDSLCVSDINRGGKIGPTLWVNILK